jgi:hypothetical protein
VWLFWQLSGASAETSNIKTWRSGYKRDIVQQDVKIFLLHMEERRMRPGSREAGVE